MLKKFFVSAVSAAILLVGTVGGYDSAHAAGAAPTAIVRDNLSKYGLKKDVELPVTVTSGGLSYTLEKIMIFDSTSSEVKQLKKLYGFQDTGYLYTNPKYFIWTKMTLSNNTKQVLTGSGNTIANTIYLSFQDGQMLDPIWPMNKRTKTNDPEALWGYSLAPGQKVTSYLGYGYNGSFNYFAFRMFFGGYVEKYVVKQ
ncbi:hypothetical protein A8L34_27675 [Bacillus sp. FJAT-27264]|uniref:hypothetical protein n=1 Tax=Paenibacillus sp. (strain DSM 101736 / FJAT-27264) TaxID=1850362 RepID=UPI00080812B1|nr:hypothetical protein [Bacillus sp. FJAT-27264]OBZ15831.1 hypothetical protein A8L34_27675 [Bacillus sp. FJAT-27264]